jgi:hypothetical protein
MVGETFAMAEDGGIRHFEVKVRAAAVSGVPDGANALATLHPVSLGDLDTALSEMLIPDEATVSSIHDDSIATDRLPVDLDAGGTQLPERIVRQ